MAQDIDLLPHAYGPPPLRGVLRRTPEDFQVDEELDFAPSGAGEHVLVRVCKRGMNTVDVARLLARHAGVAAREVSYAGLKDRHAVTTQWFSVSMPGKAEPNWSHLDSEQITVIAAERHNRKVRRGTLARNRFTVVMRELRGDFTSLPERLRRIAAEGIPNYFGEQRFGHDNLARARRMLAGTVRVRDRFERGMYLSALRSHLFNAVLARRVQLGVWSRILRGEVLILGGSRSFFIAEEVDEELRRRVAAHDLHPSAPMWGRGELHSRYEAREFEECALVDFSQDCLALARANLQMERRSARLLPSDLQGSFLGEDAFTVSFTLPPGCYATSVLRELLNTLQVPYGSY